MAGTKAGGKKTAATNIERHGEDFYRRIGAMGGSRTDTKKPKGFAANPALARIAGARGGRISKRTAGGKTRSDKGGHHNMNRKEH